MEQFRSLTRLPSPEHPRGGVNAYEFSDGVLPQSSPNHYLILEDIDRDGRLDVLGANARALAGHTRRDGAWHAVHKGFNDTADINQNFASVIAMQIDTLDARGLLFQRSGHLLVLAAPGGDGETLAEVAKLEQVELEYLVPFDQYDQWTRLKPRPDCGSFALGTGVFLSSNVPKRAVLLETMSPTTFRARPLHASAFHDVLLVAGVTVDEAEFVSLVGLRGDGRTGLMILRRTDCSAFEVLAESDVDFKPRWAPRMVRTDMDVLHNAGERLLGFSLPDGPTFCHYDGESLWCFSYRLGDGALQSTRREVGP